MNDLDLFQTDNYVERRRSQKRSKYVRFPSIVLDSRWIWERLSSSKNGYKPGTKSVFGSSPPYIIVWKQVQIPSLYDLIVKSYNERSGPISKLTIMQSDDDPKNARNTFDFRAFALNTFDFRAFALNTFEFRAFGTFPQPPPSPDYFFGTLYRSSNRKHKRIVSCELHSFQLPDIKKTRFFQ